MKMCNTMHVMDCYGPSIPRCSMGLENMPPHRSLFTMLALTRITDDTP